MTSGISDIGRGLQTEPTRGRHGTPHSLANTIGMRKDTRAWVLHEGFAKHRCEGVDNHVQVKLWAVHDSHRRRAWKQRECSKNGRRPERTTTS